jgi:trk system potassium uptake protein TrkH
MIIVFGATLICTLALVIPNMERGLELSFRESIFTVVSLQTTTGLATCDYTVWPVQLMPVLLFVMFAGACSGSTSGGFKCVRLSIIYNVLCNEIKRILHPRAVLPVKMNDNVISTSVVQTLLAFSSLFVVSLFVGAFILALSGVSPESPRQQFDYYEAFGIAMSSLSNIGPGMGYYGPVHSWSILGGLSKVVCSVLMLIGRLEIFPMLLLLTKTFWRRS